MLRDGVTVRVSYGRCQVASKRSGARWRVNSLYSCTRCCEDTDIGGCSRSCGCARGGDHGMGI